MTLNFEIYLLSSIAKVIYETYFLIVCRILTIDLGITYPLTKCCALKLLLERFKIPTYILMLKLQSQSNKTTFENYEFFSSTMKPVRTKLNKFEN